MGYGIHCLLVCSNKIRRTSGSYGSPSIILGSLTALQQSSYFTNSTVSSSQKSIWWELEMYNSHMNAK